MAPPIVSLAHDDVTVTLDELFAKNRVAELVPTYSETYKKIKNADTKKINARGAFYLLQTRRPNNIRSLAFNGTNNGMQFPEATKSKWTTMNVTAIEDTATIQWDGNVEVQDEAGLKQRPARDLDYVENEMAGIYEAYGRDKSRQIWQDRSNEVGRVSSINTSTRVVTLNNAGNLYNAQLIEEGDILEARDGSGTLKGYIQVDSVYRPAKQFIINASYIQDTTESTVALSTLGIANNDRLYPKGGFNNGYAGIPTMIATSGSFQSLSDRTIHDYLTGISIDASSRAASFALLMRLDAATRFRRHGRKASGKFYASAQMYAIMATGLATQREGQMTKLDMGFDDDEIMYRGMNFKFDYFVPRNEIHFTNLDAIDKFELREFKPVKTRQGTYIHQAPGDKRHYDRQNIYFKGIGNLGAEVPIDVGGVLTNLSTTGFSVGDD